MHNIYHINKKMHTCTSADTEYVYNLHINVHTQAILEKQHTQIPNTFARAHTNPHLKMHKHTSEC